MRNAAKERRGKILDDVIAHRVKSVARWKE